MKRKQRGNLVSPAGNKLTSSGNNEGWKEAINVHRWTQTCWYKVTATSACPLLFTPCKWTGRESSPAHCSKLQKTALSRDTLQGNGEHRTQHASHLTFRRYNNNNNMAYGGLFSQSKMSQKVYINDSCQYVWICKHKNKIQSLLEKFLKGEEFSWTFFF